MDWLQTQTKALMDHLGPERFAPPGTDPFGLVLLSMPAHAIHRVAAAVQAMRSTSPDAGGAPLVDHPLPLVVRHGLTLHDALLGQFELTVCDAVSVFLSDDVLATAPPDYLASLYADLLKSPEFQNVPFRIKSLPSDGRSREYLEYFLGRPFTLMPLMPLDLTVMRKKAKVMAYHASQIGAWVVLS